MGFSGSGLEECDGLAQNSASYNNNNINSGNGPSASIADEKRKHDSDDELDKRAKKRRVESSIQSLNEDVVRVISKTTGVKKRCQRGDDNLDNKETYLASGVKNSLHGITFQLKHLMLILTLAWKKGYRFRLATEMDAAEKFDDLVFEFEGNSGSRKHRFVQLKHKQDGGNWKIGVRELLADDDGDFSLIKYFRSWCRIKKHPAFEGSVSKSFILCTNIGFENELKKYLKVAEVAEDITLDKSQCYNLTASSRSKLFNVLKTASDLHQLAKLLATCVSSKKALSLTADLFKRHHVAIAREIVDIKEKKFKDEFIRNKGLSAKAVKFRRIFYKYVKKFWTSLKSFTFEISLRFGIESSESPQVGLPDDDIGDEEVSNFLQEFILAVNQPNEEQLDELIAQAFGKCDQFNLLNSDFLKNSFQNDILNWFKSKRGVYLVKEDAAKFFDDLERQLSSLIAVGLNSPYTQKLEKYDVKYERSDEDLEAFLKSSDPPVNRILLQCSYSEQTLLTASKIYQAVKSMEQYTRDDSFIFIELENLLPSKITNLVFRAFSSPDNHNLLIIDCGLNSAGQNTEELWKTMRHTIEELGAKKITGKRVIIIIPQKDARIVNLRSLACSIYNETVDDVSIDKLKRSTQRNLLERKVIKFQGRDEKTSYECLLGTENFEKMEDYRQIMNPKTLVQIIHGTQIRIGEKTEGLSRVEGFYIPRTIDRHVVIKNDIFKHTNDLDDIFAIGGIDEEILEKLWKDENRETKKSSQQREHRDPNKYLILRNGREMDDFDMHCRDKTNCNIHWLQRESGKLVWKQSYGSIVNLLKYREGTRSDADADEQGVTLLTEEELVDCHDDQRQVVILSDTAGMGKSTVLTRLAEIIRDNEPGLLVIKINLTDHTEVFDSEQENKSFYIEDYDGAIDFLVDKLIPNLEPEAALVFKTMIKVRREAVLLLDGFDEISPHYKEIVIDLIQALSKRVRKLFVTTRPHTSRALEKKLGAFSYSLRPFSEANQVEFLIKFWGSRIGSSHNAADMQEHTQRLITLLTKTIGRSMQEFTGVPLQTRMVAEIFPYDEGSEFTEELPNTMTIIELYRRFVDKKYEIYKRVKSNYDFTKPANKDNDKRYRQYFSNEHQKFSLDAVFDDETVGLLIHDPTSCKSSSERTEDEAIVRKGIITRFTDGKPQFIHRTFAEYFAATFLFEILIDDSRNQSVREFFVAQLFVVPEFQVIRAFLNCLLTDKDYVGQKDSWTFILKRHHNPQGETAYHVAARERLVGIVKFLLGRLTEDHRLAFSNINCLSRDCSTPLAVAMQTLHNAEVVKYLVDAGADINYGNLREEQTPLQNSIRKDANYDVMEYVIKRSDNIESVAIDEALLTAARLGKLDVVRSLETNGANPDYLNFSPLREAASFGDLELVQYLIQRGGGINSHCGYYGLTPLHRAARSGRIEVVEYLTENDANIDARTTRGETPLHLAAESGHVDVVKHLTNQGANVHSETDRGVTALHFAARSGNLEVLKYFTERVENINSLTRSGGTIMHYAAASGNHVVVGHLIERGLSIHSVDYHNETPLHRAAGFGDVSVVQYLLDNGADMNSRTHDSWTVLHYATYSDYGGSYDLGLVQFLLEQGIDVNSRTAAGSTALQFAVVTDKTNIVKYLTDHGANINYSDYCGRTVMHLAAQHGRIDVVQLFTGKGVSIHFPDYFGQTPLHLAALSGDLDLVEYLMKEGADIHSETKRGETVLYFAVRSGNFDLAEFLMEQGADIHVKTKDGETLLQAAVRFGFLNIVEYLIENGATEDGKTLLRYAAASQSLDLVKFFLKQGVDINSKTEEGETPLHQAARRGILDVVKYLTENGATIDSPTNYGQTPLHYAARFGNLDVVEYLVKNGADIHSQTEDGTTPLHSAAAFRRTDIVKHLAANGANIHSLDEYGQTPLHLAAMCNALEVVKFLTDEGANIHCQTEDGRTPLQVAAKHRAITVHAYLKKIVAENPVCTT